MLRNRPVLQMICLGVIGLFILIPIALLIPWFPADASKQASNIHTLYTVLLTLTKLIAPVTKAVAQK